MIENKYLIKIFKASPLPSLLLLPDAPLFTIEGVNTAYLKATGIKEADLIGKGIFEAFPDDPENLTIKGVSRLRQSLLKIISTKKPHTMSPQKYNIPFSSAGKFTTRYWDLKNIPVLDDEGNVVIIIHSITDLRDKAIRKGAAIQDITRRNNDEFASNNELSVYFKDAIEKKQTEESIRNSEEKRRLIMNAALDAIICIDTKGEITFWNPQAEAIFGWKDNEVMGKHLSELIIPEQFRSRHEAGIAHYIKTGKGPALNVLLDLTAINRSGEEFPIELTILPIKQGGEEFFCALIRNIIERKNAENTIRLSNERYNMVARATNDSIWDWNILTGKVTRTGYGFTTLFGYEIGQVDNANLFWTKLVHPEDLPRVHKLHARIFNKPNEFYWEDKYRFLKANGQYAYVYDKGYIIRDEDGKAIRMIGATQDITELKKSAAILEEMNISLEKKVQELVISNKELEQLAYVASHDLQEPLRMVTSFLTKLENKYGDVIDDKGKKYIDFAVDGAKRMRLIILDLLEYSRVGRTEDKREEVDLHELVNEIQILFRKQIEEKSAVIQVGRLPVIYGYKTPLRQVFQNLISNALKYTRADIPVQIRINVKGLKNHWQLSVTDNGIGISEEYFDKIFLIFQRLHSMDEFPGTGMGLAVTKKNIENLGGKIWVDSTEGIGSTFYFTIAKDISK